MNKSNANIGTSLTLKNTIQLLLDYGRFLLGAWYVYAIVLVLFIGFAWRHISQQELIYSGGISFMTTQDSGGGMQGIAQLAGQLGLSSGGGRGELSADKIIELAVSKKIIYQALLKSVTINKDEDMLFNHYIKLLNKQAIWGKTNEKYLDFLFTNTTDSSFTFLEHAAAKRIYGELLGGLINTSVSKNGIMRIRCSSASEAFSREFILTLVTTLKNFYEDRSVEQQSKTYKLINKRVDSLYQTLLNKEYALGNWLDDNRNALRAGTLSAKKMMRQERLSSEVEILNVMYGEAVRNRELALMNLLSNSPIIQIIDKPEYPLETQFVDTRLIYLFAIAGALALCTFLLAFYKLVRDALRET